MSLTPLGFLIPKLSSLILCLVSKQADRSAGNFMFLLKYQRANSLFAVHHIPLKTPSCVRSLPRKQSCPQWRHLTCVFLLYFSDTASNCVWLAIKI